MPPARARAVTGGAFDNWESSESTAPKLPRATPSIGRLQTDADLARVIDGLNNAQDPGEPDAPTSADPQLPPTMGSCAFFHDREREASILARAASEVRPPVSSVRRALAKSWDPRCRREPTLSRAAPCARMPP